MSNTKRIIIAIIAIGIIVGAAVWYKMTTSSSSHTSPNTATAPNQKQETSTPHDTHNDSVAATITYDGNTFTSSTDRVAAGSKIKVVNNSTTELDFDSDPHPVHTDNPELNQGDIEAGDSRTFTVTTKGKWGFHNHHNASQRGDITVE